jgi:hypothetical protein
LETTTEKAKIEVAAYIGGAIQRAGLKALAGDVPIMLQAGTPNQDEDKNG